jgi:hypothetical protein
MTDREQAWQIEERKFEINRLQGILRSDKATEEERRIAQDQLDHYLESEPK